MKLAMVCLAWLMTATVATGVSEQAIQTKSLRYTPAPPDNPLKGFVPYLRADSPFPHSMEWDYTPLAGVMTGPTNFNWSPFEAKGAWSLPDLAMRGGVR